MRAVPGFQLYITKREQAGSVKEELTKLVRTATVTSMNLEEMKTAIGTRLPQLKNITEKILIIFHHNQPTGPHWLRPPGEVGEHTEGQQAGQCEGPSLVVQESAGYILQPDIVEFYFNVVPHINKWIRRQENKASQLKQNVTLWFNLLSDNPFSKWHTSVGCVWSLTTVTW